MKIKTEIPLDMGDFGTQICEIEGEITNGTVHGFKLTWNKRDVTAELNPHGIEFVHGFMQSEERAAEEPDSLAIYKSHKEYGMEF